MLPFRYFEGPQQDMAALATDAVECSLCRGTGPCFHLEYALCSEISADEKESGVGCLSCLQRGRFEFWHDTEIGLLDEAGLAHVYNHNLPPPADFPMSALIDLRRTPQIVTWQQEIWLVHCSDFMTYLGTWEPKDFYEQAIDGDGRSLFVAMTDKDYVHLWDSSLPQGATRLHSWHATYYAFRCLHCGKYRGNWDCD